MKPTRVFLALLLLLGTLLAFGGCGTVSSVGLTGNHSTNGTTAAVQVYFRDSTGQLRTTRLPTAIISRTITVPINSNADLPAGEYLPTINHRSVPFPKPATP